MHAMTIVSPVARPCRLHSICSHLHDRRSTCRSICTSDVNCGPQPSQCGPTLAFSSFMPLPTLIKSYQCPQIECYVECAHMCVTTFTYSVLKN